MALVQVENIKVFEENHTGLKTNTFKPIEYIKNNNGCWEIVNRYIRKNGYIKIKRFNKDFLIHRYVYECINGPILKGFVVMHKCDNTLCINPEHLQSGTQKENLQDMKSKDRHTRGEKSGTAKLTEKQVIEIIKLLKKGFKSSQIAKQFGVSSGTIKFIKNKKTWVHLTENLL